MKNSLFSLFIVLIMSSCVDHSDSFNNKDKITILASIGANSSTTPYIAKIEIDVELKTYETEYISDNIPLYFPGFQGNFFKQNSTSLPNIIAYTGSNLQYGCSKFTHVFVIDKETFNITQCPEPVLNNRYPSNVDANMHAPRVDVDGNIYYYVESTVDSIPNKPSSYVKYSPETGQFNYLPSIDEFVLSQAETDVSIKYARYSVEFEISNEGDYLYTIAYGYNTINNLVHPNQGYLLEINLHTNEIKRIDSGSCSPLSGNPQPFEIYGKTTDHSELIYRKGNEYKVYDINTKDITHTYTEQEVTRGVYRKSGSIIGTENTIYFRDYISPISFHTTINERSDAEYDSIGYSYTMGYDNNSNCLLRHHYDNLSLITDTIVVFPKEIEGFILLD
ncbi:MAG: hypothetical protein ACERKD_05840 [Prolixibacteraceae bacterium]